MSHSHERLLKDGEAKLHHLRTSICRRSVEHAALNVAIHGNPDLPEPEEVARFLAEARCGARGRRGETVIKEHLLSCLVSFSEEDLIALRAYAALSPAANVLIDRLQALMFTP